MINKNVWKIGLAGMLWLGTMTCLAQSFPMETVYRQGMNDIRLSQTRMGRARMADATELGLPKRDLIRLDFREQAEGTVLTCLFRFGENREAIESMMTGDIYGPERIDYGMSVARRWFLPVQGLRLELFVSGTVNSNGTADYTYRIAPMTSRERAGFYRDRDGQWARFRIGACSVGIEGTAHYADRHRVLRGGVLSADTLGQHTLYPVSSLEMTLNPLIPRRDLPVPGQVYATSDTSTVFPFGFAGRVKQVKKEKDGYKVLFEPVKELDLFDIKE